MNNANSLTLRARALRTWRQERPSKEAKKVEYQAKLIEAVRQQLKLMFGIENEIEVGISEQGQIEATIEDVYFKTFIYNEETITIIPVELCPSCGKRVSLGAVTDLAELGQVLEDFKLGILHECYI